MSDPQGLPLLISSGNLLNCGTFCEYLLVELKEELESRRGLCPAYSAQLYLEGPACSQAIASEEAVSRGGGKLYDQPVGRWACAIKTVYNDGHLVNRLCLNAV